MTTMTDITNSLKLKAEQRERFNSELQKLDVKTTWMVNDNIYEAEFTSNNTTFKFYQPCLLNYSVVEVNGQPSASRFNNFDQVLIKIKQILN